MNIKGTFNITNKNFVSTGGGRRIGYAAVLAIAEMDGNVSVLDLRPAPVKNLRTWRGSLASLLSTFRRTWQARRAWGRDLRRRSRVSKP